MFSRLSLCFAAALVASVSLAACNALPVTPDTQAKIDQAAQVACIGFEAADGLFNALVSSGKIPADQQAIEAKVYAGVKSVCTPPYTADLPTLVKKATDAAAQIYALTTS